jgi:hypothetical protein
MKNGEELCFACCGRAEFRYEISDIMPILLFFSFLFFFFLFFFSFFLVETWQGRRVHVKPTRDLASCTVLYLFLHIFFARARESLHGRHFVLIIEIISRDSRETVFPRSSLFEYLHVD